MAENENTSELPAVVDTPVAEPAAPPKKRLPPGQRPYKRLDLPSPEQIMQEDMMNNCGVRTVLSGAMGSVLGVVFGIFMGTMDSSVSMANF
jgi:mitochondrial import inner membrane translocase subunit TIM22